MAWTDERVEQLKMFWAEGLSASQIASKMGGVTRNAVIGKVHRLGLSGRATPSQPKRGCAEDAGEQREETDTISATQAPEAPAPAVEPEFIAPISLTDDDLTTVATLQRNMCKWPIGDPASDDFHFCGEPTAPGKSYCAYHAQMAFQPSHRREAPLREVPRIASVAPKQRATG